MQWDLVGALLGVALGGAIGHWSAHARFSRELKLSKLERAYEVCSSVDHGCMDLYMEAYDWAFNNQGTAADKWRQLQAYQRGLKQIPIGELMMLVEIYGESLQPNYDVVRAKVKSFTGIVSSLVKQADLSRAEFNKFHAQLGAGRNDVGTACNQFLDATAELIRQTKNINFLRSAIQLRNPTKRKG